MKQITAILALILLFSAFGCSSAGSDNSVMPAKQPVSTGPANHISWGMYQFTADPAKQTLDVVPLRGAEFHLNALGFLEPPVLLYLSLESLLFNGNIIETDIGLRHPFAGLDEFTGFDVSGLVITNGSYSGFADPDIRYAGPGDTRLLNPDGYSRWWNPNDMPINSTAPVFGYIDGMLGTPDSMANFNTTINPYKYFCDDLTDPNGPVSAVTQASRGMFSPGVKNIRHYTIELGTAGLVFNYAVDACWLAPNGNGPWQVPDDFPLEANRVEPWNILVNEVDNTLYYENGDAGGGLHLSIDVYDWANASENTLYVESVNGVIPQVGPLSPVGGGAGFSTYDINIAEAFPITAGNLDILISAKTAQLNFQGFIPGTNTSAYLVYKTTVSNTAPIVPEDPVIIDDQGCFGTALGIDENNVIHTAYADQYQMFWSYSTNHGASWVNLGPVYSVTGDLVISTNTISMCSGPSDGYVYIAWAESSYSSVHRALRVGRMPVDLSGNFEDLLTWDHPTGNPEQHWDGTQILALDNGEFFIYGMFYYQLGGGFRPEYTRVSNFASLAGAPELEVNLNLSGGWMVYNYTSTTRELDSDSLGNVYLLNSGRFDNPGYNRGSFILKNDVTTNQWSFFNSYTPTGNSDNVWYWDNRSNGLFIDDSDNIHLVSEWQTCDNPTWAPPADDGGYYTLMYAEGPTSGVVTWTDPVPGMSRGIPNASGYPWAKYDWEWLATSCVEDDTGRVYIVFQDTYNTHDAYFITYDGSNWNHSASSADWVKINTTAGQSAFQPYAIKGLDGYVYVTYTDTADANPGFPVFKAIKDQ